MISTAAATDALWLDTLNRICGKAAHELKGVLNGTSVNLEVVRSRANRPDAPASAVAQFATAASSQFDEVMEMTDALLALARAAQGPSDVAVTTKRFVALLGPVAKVDGRSLAIEGALDAIGATTADGNAVRLAIGSVLCDAVESAASVVCIAGGGALRVEAREGTLTAPGVEIASAVREAGIEFQAEPSAISITFPR